MYEYGFRITENIGNNSFSYDIRKLKNSDPKIYVTNLIQGTIDDIQIGDKIVFEETDSKGEVKSFLGLKNFVKIFNCHSGVNIRLGGLQPESNIGDNLCPIYIFDNHNHSLFFRYQELFNGTFNKPIKLIHIDQHTDMNNNSNVIANSFSVIASEAKQSYLKNIFQFTNYKCNVGNFIQPAIQSGLISEVIQINTEYKLLDVSTFQRFSASTFILDIDLDFRHPQMGIEQYTKTIEITKNLISQASLVTIATSPYFLDQTLAIKVLKDLLY